MKHLLVSAVWTMLAGAVIVPLADHLLARRSKQFHYNPKRTAQQNHEDWIKWWLLENHPGAKNAQRKK